MAVFNPITITDNGKEMLTQALAGQGTLTFVSVSTSTSTPSNPEDLTTLTGIKQTVTPASAILDGNVIQVSALFSNSDLTQGYTANSLGLYAKLGDGAQTLFAVVTATEPDVFPAQNAQSPSSFLYQFNISISDTSQITIAVPEGGNLSAAVFYQTFPGLTPPTEENAGDMMVVEDNGEWGYVDSKNAIVQSTATGEFLSFETSLAIPMDNVLLYGKSTQYNTGANLFDINAAKSGGAGDITITDYGTGEFTVSTQNNVAFQGIALKDWCPTLKLDQFCTLSGTTTSADKCLRSAGGAVWNFGETRTISNEDLADKWYFVATTKVSTSGTTAYYEDTFSGVMVTYGSTVPPYEVYTAGTGEPSPDTPIPIVSVGEYNEETEKYEVGITITNKNLASDINVYSGYYYDTDGTPSPADSRFVRVSMIKVFPGVRYAISSNLNIYSITMYDNNRKKVSFTTAPINQKTLVINPGKKVTYLGVSLHNTSGAEDTSAFEFLQVETGTKASPYVAGERKNITLSLSEPLRGIPVDSGGNYTDAKGQKFLGDVADKQKSKIYRGCGSKTFNGSETWYADTSNHIYTYITSDAKMYPSNALCDSYVFKNDAVQLGQSDFGFAMVGSYYIQFKNVNVQSLDDWKSMLQTRPITIVYPLATPTEESLTPDQLAALNLSTYEGVTNIGTDSNAGIEVEYQTANFATDIAQKTFDLQSTVRSQGTAITQNETDIENINNVLNSPLVSYNGLLPVVNPSGIYTYKSVADIVYPIGSIYLSVNNINPGTIFGGTWVSWGSGQVPVGVNTSVSQFATVEQTGGEITHTLTTAEMPSHDHSISGGACTTGSGGSHNHTYGVTVHPAVGFTLGPNGYSTVTGDNQNTSSNGNHSHSVPNHAHDIGNTGGGQAHNNLQPYITCYMWKRTA